MFWGGVLVEVSFFWTLVVLGSGGFVGFGDEDCVLLEELLIALSGSDVFRDSERPDFKCGTGLFRGSVVLSGLVVLVVSGGDGCRLVRGDFPEFLVVVES